MAHRVDLRSDTVTQPTPAMREAMANALVGDDGHGEDPTINALENRFAQLVGKESAIFVPSGVMANQIAMRVLTRPGDVVIAGAHQHVVSFEMGASARNAGIQFDLLDDRVGALSPDDVASRLDAELDHQAAVAAISVENTHMYAGGVPLGHQQLTDIAAIAGSRPLHLDGARLFNAAIATGESPALLAQPATTVMACLSKGLCAPVGSLLAGPNELMEAGRVERKRLGGAMRQAGVLAAAGLIALEVMTRRLDEDHARARRLAHAVAERFGESNYDPSSCRTNIVAFDHVRARDIVTTLGRAGVLAETIGPQRVRLVTHHDVGDDDIDIACDVIASLTFN